MLPARLAVVTACLALVVPQFAAEAASKQRSVVWNYTTPAGVTDTYPQQFFHLRSGAPHEAVRHEAVGGVQDRAKGTEDRFHISAQDSTGRPVAVSLYWFAQEKDKDPQYLVVCGTTKAPLPIIRTGVVHAMVTAGGGCPGTVSAPTRGSLTFTWTTAPKSKKVTRR